MGSRGIISSSISPNMHISIDWVFVMGMEGSNYGFKGRKIL